MGGTSTAEGLGKVGFIERHDLWTDQQREAKKRVDRLLDEHDVRLVRLAFVDQHGVVRAKALTRSAFEAALRNGGEMNTGPIMFDTGSAIVYNPFIPGGGFDMAEMTGCPNFLMVPDPETFRILPWSPTTGFVLCDLYFPDASPLPFCSRGVLRRTLDRLHERGLEYVAGLEVEWYVTRLDEHRLAPEQVGSPGHPGDAPQVRAASQGFQYHLEQHLDEIDDFVNDLVATAEQLELPLRTIEDEWGPGQLETTFDPLPGLGTADAMALFRSAAKQVARRHGLLATFMCRPGFENFFSSGWHLHQSLVDRASGTNLFTPDGGVEGAAVSPTGRQFIAGILDHARAASVFTTPTVNGYKRLKPYSLAPDRASWGYDNRGTLARAMGGAGDASSRFENRVGEPGANPYLYLASQIASGMDGLDRNLDPGPPTENPYEVDVPLLPQTLREAVDALKEDPLFRDHFGERFVDYIVGLKESELHRYDDFVSNLSDPTAADGVTDWEHREYFQLL